MYSGELDNYKVIAIDSSFREEYGLIVVVEFIYDKSFSVKTEERFFCFNENSFFVDKERIMIDNEIDIALEIAKRYIESYLKVIIILDGSILKRRFNTLYTFDLPKNVFITSYTSNSSLTDYKFEKKQDLKFSTNSSGFYETTDWFDLDIFISSCYIDLKAEVARLEFFKLNENKDMSYFFKIIFDQIKKGGGYPLILGYVHLQTQKIKDYISIERIAKNAAGVFRIKDILKIQYRKQPNFY